VTDPHLAGELNRALRQALESDSRVHLLGEDVVDPYGGAFKVTRGLSDEFGRGRIHATPISEAAIVGLAVGMALRGLRPVVEIMFGDFLTLAADQIVNHACKWRFVSGDRVTVPIVVRTPMGGGRAYGATHSQSLEARFLGVPGLTVVAASRFGDPAQLLRAAIDADDPVLFVEPKSDYPTPVIRDRTQDLTVSTIGGRYPATLLTPGASPELLLICYGAMATACADAAVTLSRHHGVSTEVLVAALLHPADLDEAAVRLSRHGRAVVVEEGPRSFGWGAEVAASLTEACFENLEAPVARVGALDSPLGAAPGLEDEVLPGPDDIVAAALGLWR